MGRIRGQKNASASSGFSFGGARNYKMPVRGSTSLMAADSGPIKIGPSVVLNHGLTDVHSEAVAVSLFARCFLKLLGTFPHVHRLPPCSSNVSPTGGSGSLLPNGKTIFSARFGK